MRRQITGFCLIVCGLWIILGVLVAGVAAPVASASPRLAPSPRPTIERPTAEPQGSGGDHSSKRSGDGAPATGRLTGTIIDTATGAPAPGITVSVGGVQVTSDANGNYDTWLPVGSYSVGLTLSGRQGTDLLGPQAVVVRSADTTVQHLYFRGAAAPALVATVAAPAGAPAQAAADVSAGSAAAPATRPTRLPVTAVPADTSWLWLSLGVSLVLGGAIVGWGNRRSAMRFLAQASAARADANALLVALLNTRVPAAPRSDEALLRALLGEAGEDGGGKSA